jgi:hypothetical protein
MQRAFSCADGVNSSCNLWIFGLDDPLILKAELPESNAVYISLTNITEMSSLKIAVFILLTTVFI